MKRTHTCGELSEKQIGKKVCLQGWVSTRRDHGPLIFIDLRDRYGFTQVVFNQEISSEVHKLAKTLGREFVVEIEGKVSRRPKGTDNKKIKTGSIEIGVSKLKILNSSEQPLPLEIDAHLLAGEDVRLKYRYLDLRRPEMQKNIVLRHKIVKAIRDFFDNENFIEIETPVLAKSTPEGSRDYLVPSRIFPGKFFALPQSPQQFKQLLMVSGFDRYFQIVRCFRDEDLRADRQPEFTQLDIEMSFVEPEDIYCLMENCFKEVFKKVLGIQVKIPFPRMIFDDAMNFYGSDKPDTRFGLKFLDLTKELAETEFEIFNSIIKKGGFIKAVVVPKPDFSKKDLSDLLDAAKTFKAKGLVTMEVKGDSLESQIAKFLKPGHVKAVLEKTKARENDLILLIADEWRTCCTALGAVRLKVAEKLSLIDKNKFSFLWVTEFPLLEFSEEEQKLVAMHHPFTSPADSDADLLEKEPLKVKSKAYDCILNGSEIGGGSIRIHKREMQSRMFKALGISDEEAEKKFGHLLTAFKFGAPPHGGIAFGIDRLAAIICGTDSIREVIAFPKNKSCSSLMDDSPSEVSAQQLKELKLKIDLEK
ncbi:MAG: aspartate--tRNA ligase [Candidatus ainarchaeum sp.]|nr:aspartate--tRNA ligase [Candidatus ainarchaeum sp.]